MAGAGRMVEMSEKENIDMPADKIAEFCKGNGFRKLSLFGSALRNDFRPDSDIDLLVEFMPAVALKEFHS
jgi:predicted nucleotidyltransferase